MKNSTDPDRNRFKQIDMMGALGAAVVGAGVALLFNEWLLPFARPAVFIGITAHGWSMFAKNRLERRSDLFQPLWETVTYWTCWVLLAALMGYVLMHIIL